MKDKTIITAMFCTAADGWRAPIALIGKSNNPHCFNFLGPRLQPPLYEREKNIEWFDKEVTQ